MNAHHMAAARYGEAGKTVKSHRQIEYSAFARVTRSMSEAAGETLPEPERFPRLASALHENLRLWTVIAADVSSSGNALPEALRAQLFYLSEFTRTHTSRVLSRDATAEPLIEINTTVMRGLRERSGAETCPA